MARRRSKGRREVRGMWWRVKERDKGFPKEKLVV